MLPLDAPYTEPSTGIPQPPGGIMFALRCEVGAPGKGWRPVEAHWQVAPLLLPQGNPAAGAALPGGYGAAAAAPGGAIGAGVSGGGLLGQVAGLLPGETGVKLQSEAKKLGHKFANFVNKF